MRDRPSLHTGSAEQNRLLDIAVIIVNYGTADLTIEAVESGLARTHGGRRVTIHVVDNASPGNSVALLNAAHEAQGWGAQVKLWPEDTNHGFGRGNNLVIGSLLAHDTPPDAIFLLNPDAQLENEVMDIMAQQMELNPSVGFTGAAISTPDGEVRVAAFRFPSILSEFTQSLAFGPVSRLFDKWTVPLPPETPAGPVDWVAGAAVLIRSETLRELRGFDPDFFLYYEEVDLMRRGAVAGWKCHYVPQARVIHIEGAATDIKSKRETCKRMPSYRYQSWRLYFTKSLGRIGAVLAAFASITGTIGNQIIARIRRKETAAPRYFFRDFWRHALKPLLFGA